MMEQTNCRRKRRDLRKIKQRGLWFEAGTLLLSLALVSVSPTASGLDINKTKGFFSRFDHSYSMQNEIKGLVVDAAGQPIPGATVAVAGDEARKTGTDNSGHFSIHATAGERLQVTSVGYSLTIVEIVDTKDLRIVLEIDDADIDEVVVVGYGTQ